MKQVLLLCAILNLVFLGCTHEAEDKGKIIFDTDLGPDYDDVGALAFLHAMADSGKVEILATVSSNKQELVVPSIEVINTWFNRLIFLSGLQKQRDQTLVLHSTGQIP